MEVIGSSWKGEMVYFQIFNENPPKNLFLVNNF